MANRVSFYLLDAYMHIRSVGVVPPWCYQLIMPLCVAWSAVYMHHTVCAGGTPSPHRHALHARAQATIDGFAVVSGTDPSTSMGSGALQVSGGIGVSKNSFFGDQASVTGIVCA